jgi:hypothetical protein
MSADGVPKVEHVVLLAPVGYVGSGLTTGDGDTAAPIGSPVPAIGVPGSVPSGEVALSAGVELPSPIWANTGLQQHEAETAATTSNDLMEDSPKRAEG